MQERHRRTYPADPRGLCQRGRISPLEGLVRRRLLQHRKRRAQLLRQRPPPGPPRGQAGSGPFRRGGHPHYVGRRRGQRGAGPEDCRLDRAD